MYLEVYIEILYLVSVKCMIIFIMDDLNFLCYEYMWIFDWVFFFCFYIKVVLVVMEIDEKKEKE